jgi:DNA-binding NarL/FixJ family response regulator
VSGEVLIKGKSMTRRAENPVQTKNQSAISRKNAEEATDGTCTTRSTNENPRCNAPEAKRIVVVDDHPLFRKGLEEMIHSDGTFAVCGEAGTAAEGMEVIRKLHPDLVIVDLSLPGANGIELIKNIRAEFQKLPILVLSMHDESLYALRALRAGAEGYVMKHEAMTNVIQAIREVFNGRPYLSPAMAAQVITKFAHRESEEESDAVERLSDRELEILELIGKGKDVREIARLLHLSPKTVETHRSHIKDKLDLKNSREVARFALQWLSTRNA